MTEQKKFEDPKKQGREGAKAYRYNRPGSKDRPKRFTNDREFGVQGESKESFAPRHSANPRFAPSSTKSNFPAQRFEQKSESRFSQTNNTDERVRRPFVPKEEFERGRTPRYARADALKRAPRPSATTSQSPRSAQREFQRPQQRFSPEGQKSFRPPFDKSKGRESFSLDFKGRDRSLGSFGQGSRPKSVADLDRNAEFARKTRLSGSGQRREHFSPRKDRAEVGSPRAPRPGREPYAVREFRGAPERNGFQNRALDSAERSQRPASNLDQKYQPRVDKRRDFRAPRRDFTAPKGREYGLRPKLEDRIEPRRDGYSGGSRKNRSHDSRKSDIIE